MKTIQYKIAQIKFLLIVLIAMSFKGYSQSASYFSLQNGDYIDFNIWGYNSQTENCGCIPDNDNACGIIIPANKTVHIRHALTTSCDLHIGANSVLIVETGGSLTLSGTASMIGDGLFQIDAGGLVNIGGNLNLTGNATVLNNGNLNIGENLTFGGSSSLCGTGILDVDGDITGGTPCGLIIVLPIELTYFEGQINENKIDLIWETASELNNDFFEIEKSHDGLNYSLVERVDSKAINGNSLLKLKYMITDESPFEGMSYYRLKQVDFDHRYKYSTIISINNLEKALEVDFFPNPSKGQLYTKFSNIENKEAIFELRNSMNEIVFSDNLKTSSSNGNVNMVALNEIPSGIYFCTLSVGSKMYTKKIILLPN